MKRYNRGYVIVLVALISLGIFYSILPSVDITGFVAYDPENPSDLEIDLIKDVFDENEIVDADVVLELKGPVLASTLIKAELGDKSASKRLDKILEESGIDFLETGALIEATNPSTSKSIVFPSAGKQRITFKLPEGSIVESIDMDVTGLDYNGEFPGFPSMDVDGDGNTEWHFFGELVNFSDFVKPSGLNENVESDVLINDRENYYCEIINLGYGKDFNISAKYGIYNSSLAGNMSAVIFSISGSGSQVTGHGGGEKCDLKEPISGNYNYYGCSIRTSLPIRGNHLVCVFNSRIGSSDLNVYKIARDNDEGNGYRCGALSSGGSASCTRQSGDFHIKVQNGVYDGKIRDRYRFSEWLTEFSFKNAMNEILEDCVEIGGGCGINVEIESKSPGILYLDSLNIEYNDAGSEVIERNFYDSVGKSSVIYDIESYELANESFNLTFELNKINLAAPFISVALKNFTLKVLAEPGPSDTAVLTIKDIGIGNVSGNLSMNLSEEIVSYRNLFNNFVGDFSEILDIARFKENLAKAVISLDGLNSKLSLVRASNKTIEQKRIEELNISREFDKIIEKLPKSVIVKKDISDVIAVGNEDIDEILLEDLSEEDSVKIGYLQNLVKVNGNAKYFEIKTFDNKEVKGTLIVKEINSRLANVNLFEKIPKSVASLEKIEFKEGNEIINEDPVIAKYKFSNLNNVKISYFVEGDVAGKLNLLKTVVIPEVIPEEALEFEVVCGDNVCSVLDIDGEKIKLEDEYSCPQDCKKGIPWLYLSIAIIIVLLGLYYINFYKGRYNLNELLGKLKFGKLRLGKERNPFSSNKEEQELRKYVFESLKRGLRRDRIEEILVEKGWGKEQVDYIFRHR